MFRAAWGLGDIHAMDAALDLFRSYSERTIAISHVRAELCYALRFALEDGLEVNREAIECLVRETLGTMNMTEWLREEGLEVLRLWAALGHHLEARETLAKKVLFTDAETALLRLDLALCQLGDQHGWRPPAYMLSRPSAAYTLPAPLEDEAEIAVLSPLLKTAEAQAVQEDLRMECTYHQQRVVQRQRWLSCESTTPIYHRGCETYG